MDFETAVKYLKQGEKIKRGKWRNAYLMIEDQKLKMSLGRERAWSYSLEMTTYFQQIGELERSKYPKGKGVILCPFHKEETPSCLLDMENERFHCLSCGQKGKFELNFFIEEEVLI